MDTKTEKFSVLFLANASSPNTRDIYDRLVESYGVEVMVWYCVASNKKWEQGVPAWKHPSRVLFNWNFLSDKPNFTLSLSIIPRLLFNRFSLIVVQGYSSPTHFICLGLLGLLGRPWAFWGERIRSRKSGTWTKRAVKALILRLLHRAKRIYAVGSKGVEDYLEAGLPKQKVIMLPYARDLSQYRSVTKRNQCGGKSTRQIVTTARLVAPKRLDVLLDTFVRLADRYPEWTLAIIGSGPLGPELDKIAPAHIRGRVIWHGFADAAAQCEIYAKSDIFVLPSEQDGWGMVLIEAMAAGLPVIATEGVLSAWDVIRSEVDGYMIPSNDGRALEEHLEALMGDSMRRKAMGKKAAEASCSWDVEAIASELMTDLSRLGPRSGSGTS